MANKFVGFKPETLTKKILPALGYDGPTDEASINLFLAASPAAAAKMGRYTMAARQMVEGRPVNANKGFAALKAYEALPPEKKTVAARNKAMAQFQGKSTVGGINQKGQNPIQAIAGKPVTAEQHSQAIRDFSSSIGSQRPGNTAASVAQTPPQTTTTTETTTQTDTSDSDNTTPQDPGLQMPSGSGATQSLLKRGGAGAATYTPDTAGVTDPMIQGGQIATGTGQAGAAQQAQMTSAGTGTQASLPGAPQVSTMDPTQAANAVGDAARASRAAQGSVSRQAQVSAAQADPTGAAQLGLQAAQLGQAQTVDAPDPMRSTPDQLVSGATVDQKRVEETLALSEAASVADELGELMQDFDGGDTPAWAAGAMRAANAAMAARGLSASSMAGMAVVQAAMESALPIAQMDAANKQQMAMAKAEQRAKFLGMEFDQSFQTKVKNAARISEIANINFSAEQQVALENARMAQTVDLSNLSNKQAKIMSDAAAMTQMDMANLNNRQQANVQNAQAFLAMDMANLDNEQQNSMFQSQSIVNSLFTDAAADNAAKQFNATSANQAEQFFTGLSATVAQFNTEQSNAMARFNAGEANALSQFNTGQENLRDQFNATNHLVVSQANTQWFQNLTTADNAAVNQANRDAAMAANNLTMTAYNNTVQRERDILAWAWQSGENQSERQNNIAVAKITGGKDADAVSGTLGRIAGKLVDNAATYIFDSVVGFDPFSAVSS